MTGQETYRVGDKVRTKMKFRSPTGIILPKHSPGVVKWADGDKYIVEITFPSGSKEKLQFNGNELQKRGLFAGR